MVDQGSGFSQAFFKNIFDKKGIIFIILDDKNFERFSSHGLEVIR